MRQRSKKLKLLTLNKWHFLKIKLINRKTEIYCYKNKKETIN